MVALTTEVDTLDAEVVQIGSDLSALATTVADLKPVRYFEHATTETDGHTLPDTITNGKSSDSSTHIRQLTYTPQNAGDTVLGFAVEGDLEVDTLNRTLIIIAEMR